MLIRYFSAYSEIITSVLKNSDINDYIFTSHVSFIKKKSDNKNTWPQICIALIVTAPENNFFDFIKQMKKHYSKNPDLKKNIKFFVLPVYKEG
jgi:hypothetical protein